MQNVCAALCGFKAVLTRPEHREMHLCAGGCASAAGPSAALLSAVIRGFLPPVPGVQPVENSALLFQTMALNLQQLPGNISLYANKAPSTLTKQLSGKRFSLSGSLLNLAKPKPLIYFAVQMPAQADSSCSSFTCPRSLSFALQEHLGSPCGLPSGTHRFAFSCKGIQYDPP